ADQIAQLSQAPGLEWMAQVRQMPGVDWQAIEEAHKAWSEEHQSLGQGAKAIIVIAIAIATMGAGGVLLAPGMAVASAAGLAGTAAGAALAAAVNAAVSTIILQTTYSMIANQGDLGAVFQELGSSAFLMQLASAVVTAGLTAGLTDAALSGLDLPGLNVAASELTFVERLERVALQATIRNTIQFGSNVALYGQDPGEAALAMTRSLGADVVGAMVAYEMGALVSGYQDTTLGYIGDKVAQAAVGCATGAIAGGSCTSRALGAALSAMAMDAYLGELDRSAYTAEEWFAIQQRMSKIGELAAALGATLTGQNADEAVAAAQNVAENSGKDLDWLLGTTRENFAGLGDTVDEVITALSVREP
ncbi:DUF637 domain-containing protein, partial [Rhodospirillum sp. A1_3_36]|uniref:DUF637 domain-containing protein n=1 Tax=Rhodospirillum sp. A1_3_36 TaxID=3391666 RepID=UPI0039A740C0